MNEIYYITLSFQNPAYFLDFTAHLKFHVHNSHVWLVAITETGKHRLVKVTSTQLHPVLRAKEEPQ